MKYLYDINSLEELFEKHHEEYEKQNDLRRKMHKEMFNEDSNIDEFSIARALLTIVKEIKKLKEEDNV